MKEKKIPIILVILGSIIFIINAIILAIYSLGVAVQIFDASIAVGLVMALTGIGWLVFVPSMVALAPFGLYESISSIQNKFEYWTKAIAIFALGSIAPHLVYVATAFITLLIASILENFIN